MENIPTKDLDKTFVDTKRCEKKAGARKIIEIQHTSSCVGFVGSTVMLESRILFL
jgi:hypothetical protein